VRYRAATYTALILIDGTGAVKSTFGEMRDGADALRFLCADASRLLPEIESAVLALLSDSAHRERSDVMLAVLEDGSVMRVSPLLGNGEDGNGDDTYALVIEADRNKDYVTRAVSRYGLTKRQTDVLLHVLEGANAGDVAAALHISEYTAQGYIKALLTKTASRNRTAMVAKILEWPSAGPARSA
jgi:DNA-binding CsgD family transcriptional regulator